MVTAQISTRDGRNQLFQGGMAGGFGFGVSGFGFVNVARPLLLAAWEIIELSAPSEDEKKSTAEYAEN